MSFNFSTAGQIIFGPGAVNQLPNLVAGFGTRAFLVLDTHLSAEEPPVAGVAPNVTVWRGSGEPSVSGIRAAVDAARDFRPDVVVGIGGGSTVDTAKAIGILLGNSGDILDYLEVVGRGRTLTPSSLPVIAVSTTAGTGAEVTANTPIFSEEHNVKASLRSPAMLPNIAVVDPELTVSSPPAVTASSGLDALTQNLEPYTSCKANPLTDILAAEGLKRAASGLRAAYADGTNIEARTDMALCSLLGGLSLANSKLGAVHGLAAPLGGMLHAAHGEVCAAVLAATTETNVAAMRERDSDNPALDRYLEASRLLTGDSEAHLDDGLAWIRETVDMLGVRSLGQLGLTEALLDEATKGGLAASSMKGNPIVLTYDEVYAILARSM